MFFSNKRGISLSIETLVKLILLTAFLLIAIGLVIMVQRSFSQDGAKKYSCWFTSSMKASDNPLKGIFPDTCSARNIDKALGMADVARLLRDTWWQYGEGKADFGVTVDQVYEAARFKVSEEFSTDDMLKYLLTHRKEKASSMENSDYNYLQENAGTRGASTVCFDSEIEKDGRMMKPGVDYTVYFGDSISFTVFLIKSYTSDRLIIMKGGNPNDYKDSGKPFFCYSPLTKGLVEGEIYEESYLGKGFGVGG